MRIWQSIIDGPDEAVVILEHDAIMLQPLTIDIPDNKIVVLGYKVEDPSRYNHKSAGPPNELIDINGHEGAHAYAITRTTARFLIEEITRQGIRSAIDNDYFIRGQRRTAIPLSIASPTPALGWLRKSTIWGASASKNYEFVASFSKNYK
jgi:GR25 family glycosyltransferase involved in LPS biosynthesis